MYVCPVEHILAIVAALAVAYDCSFGRNLVESYFVNCYPQVFDFTEYALWKGALLQVRISKWYISSKGM